MSAEDDEISVLSRPILPPWSSKPELNKQENLFCPWEYPDAQPPPPPPHYANWSPVSPRKAIRPAGLTAPTDVVTPRPVHFNRPSLTGSPLTHRRVLFRPDAHRRSHSEGRKPYSSSSDQKPPIKGLAPRIESSVVRILPRIQKEEEQPPQMYTQIKNKENEVITLSNSDDSFRQNAKERVNGVCSETPVTPALPENTHETTDKTRVTDVKLQSKRVSRKKNENATPTIDQKISSEAQKPPWRNNDGHSTKQPNVKEIPQQDGDRQSQVSSAYSEASVDSSATITMVSVHSQSAQTQQSTFLQQHQRVAQQPRQQQTQAQSAAEQTQVSQAQQQPVISAREAPWRSPRTSRREVGKPPSAPKDKNQDQVLPSWRSGHVHKTQQPASKQPGPPSTVSITPAKTTTDTLDQPKEPLASDSVPTSYVSSVSLTTVSKVESKISESVEQVTGSASKSSQASSITQQSASSSSLNQNGSKVLSLQESKETSSSVPVPPPPPPESITTSKILTSNSVETTPKIVSKVENSSVATKSTETNTQVIPLTLKDETVAQLENKDKDISTIGVNVIETMSQETALKFKEKSSIDIVETKTVESISELSSANESLSISENQSTNVQEPISPPLPPPPPPNFCPCLPQDRETTTKMVAQEILLLPQAITTTENLMAHQEINTAQQFEISSQEESKEFSVEPIIGRIQKFEKQSSFESDKKDTSQRQAVPAKPVGPWVKKTSSGPVSQEFDPDNSKAGNEYLPFVTPERQMLGDPSVPTAAPEGLGDQLGNSVVAFEPPIIPERRQHPRVEQHQHLQNQMTQNIRSFQGRTLSSEPVTHSYEFKDKGGRLVSTNKWQPNLSTATSEAPPPAKPGDPLFDPWCDPSNPRIIQFQDISAAAFKIKSGIMNTPCTRSNMSHLLKCEVFFKKEFNQFTGSIKERGARYALLSLSEEQRKKGVIGSSAGNQALALSYHGQSLGIPVTVVMPLFAPIMKVNACRQYGANVIVAGRNASESKEVALKMAKEKGLLYINGYDHPHIVAGQGTIGLEIVEQVNNIDAVVVPVGGGALIAGLALAVKSLYPHIQVIGVEAENCPSFSAALAAGKPVRTKNASSLADGLTVPQFGVNSFATARNLIDKIVTVSEEWIAIAILRLVEMEKAVVEGGGATALAALLAGKLPELQGKRVVIPLCGGNIDTTVLGRCLERGMAAEGRLAKFTVTVSDRPGAIAELTQLLANLGVSIKDMIHERAWIKSDVFSVQVKVVCETRDYAHLIELQNFLECQYEEVRFNMPKIVT